MKSMPTSQVCCVDEAMRPSFKKTDRLMDSTQEYFNENEFMKLKGWVRGIDR